MGVPLRVEFGPKDAAKGVVTTVRRDTGVKGTLEIGNIAALVSQLLQQIQQDMFSRAKTAYDSHRVPVTEWDNVIPTLNDKNVLLVPHCLDGDCADAVKKETADLCKTAADVDPRAPSMGAKCECYNRHCYCYCDYDPFTLHPFSCFCFCFVGVLFYAVWLADEMNNSALCIPFDQEPLAEGTKCLRPSCGRDAQKWLLIGRSY